MLSSYRARSDEYSTLKVTERPMSNSEKTDRVMTLDEITEGLIEVIKKLTPEQKKEWREVLVKDMFLKMPVSNRVN